MSANANLISFNFFTYPSPTNHTNTKHRIRFQSNKVEPKISADPISSKWLNFSKTCKPGISISKFQRKGHLQIFRSLLGREDLGENELAGEESSDGKLKDNGKGEERDWTSSILLGDFSPNQTPVCEVTGGIVALGKFDALHIGHRELAIQASKVGVPFLLSFSGMAEVLGWEPRAPIVAQCDRKRVLSSWARFCQNMVPEEYQMEFSSIRHLSPQQFVEKLSKELGVCGVVAGENYRFGYKAAGDTQDLIKLCQEYGMKAYIIKSVMDENQYQRNFNFSNSKDRGQVSSTRIRHALAAGDMNYVSRLLGRQHRLVLISDDQRRFTASKNKLSGPRSCLLNLAPKEGLYEDCSLIFGDHISLPCRVVLDKTQVHIETEVAVGDLRGSQDFQYLSIEFSVSEA